MFCGPGYIAAPQASSSAAISSTVWALYTCRNTSTIEAVPIYAGARNLMAPMACACPTQYAIAYAWAPWQHLWTSC